VVLSYSVPLSFAPGRRSYVWEARLGSKGLARTLLRERGGSEVLQVPVFWIQTRSEHAWVCCTSSGRGAAPTSQRRGYL